MEQTKLIAKGIEFGSSLPISSEESEIPQIAIKWTQLSNSKVRNNEVRLQLHALAYNLGNFMRTLALPKEVEN